MSKVDGMVAAPPPFRSLVSLDISVFGTQHLDSLETFIDLVSGFSRNLRTLSIDLNMPGILRRMRPDVKFCASFSGSLCNWQNLQTVDCGNVALQADALAHLSRMPTLARLNITPTTPLPAPLSFSDLPAFQLNSRSLAPVSQFLSSIRLPAATEFTVVIEARFSKQDLDSFFSSVQASVVVDVVQELTLQEDEKYDYRDTTTLDFEDMRPCMAFDHLRRLTVNVSWVVLLKDNELLRLASAWPRLEELLINEHSGWVTSGITPNGLLELLQTCRSLRKIALAINTEVSADLKEWPQSLGLTFPPTLSINFLDSHVDAEDIPAMVSFVSCIARGCDLSIRAFRVVQLPENWKHWYEVCKRAKEVVGQHGHLVIDSALHGSYRF